jgi:hypothetical protein
MIAQRERVKEVFNVNSLLLIILIGLGTYTLRKISELGENGAVTTSRLDTQGEAIKMLSSRVDNNSRDIVELRVSRRADR